MRYIENKRKLAELSLKFSFNGRVFIDISSANATKTVVVQFAHVNFLIDVCISIQSATCRLS